MTDLLIHSMSEFSELILGCMERANVRNIVEVGAEFGGMSHHLAARAQAAGGSFISIDPTPKPEFLDWVASQPHVRHLPQPSLAAIPTLADVDAWVIDGDHNYYTVINELRGADAIAKRDGRPLLAFLHDVSWPCARRDFYYAPERIPAEYRLEHHWDAGVVLDDNDLHVDRGFRGHGNFAWALRFGGPRNGVLTAVEDFLEEARTDDRPLAFAFVPAVFGLGVLFDGGCEWSPAIAEFVHPWHDNRLLATLEANRLRNYLTVLDWQDRDAQQNRAA